MSFVRHNVGGDEYHPFFVGKPFPGDEDRLAPLETAQDEVKTASL